MIERTPEAIKEDLVMRVKQLPDDKLEAVDMALRQVEQYNEDAIIPDESIADMYAGLDDAVKMRISRMLTRENRGRASSRAPRTIRKRENIPNNNRL